jgi:prephenate dehydrogenase
MKIVIFGIGLIGGSIAKDLRERNFATEIIGVGRSEASNQKALELGLVDKILPREEAVKIADLIVLAVPVNALIGELLFVLDNIQPHQTVTDMGSTKKAIIDAVGKHKNRRRFVASHPMSGTEKSGPTAAINNLFDNKICIICEKENSDGDAVEVVEKMYNCLNMNIKYMNARQHDIHAAYVSHISHVSSFVLAATVLEKEKDEEAIFEMAAGGFASTARLAKSSPEMWMPIFIQNKNSLLEAIDTYIEKIYHFRNLINKEKQEELSQFMKEANKIKRILK